MIASRYFEVFVDGPITVVKFTEKYLNDSNIQQVADELAGVAGELGQGELHLDFSAVTYLSSFVLAKLFSLHKRVTSEGGRFVLTNVDALYDIFHGARLDTLMEIHRKAAGDGWPPTPGPI